MRAGNGGQSRGSARADNNQPKSGSNSSRNGAGDGGDVGIRSSGIGNGDGGNGGDNVAAMAAVMANMAPTVAEGSADVGGGHLSYFLLFLHNRRIRTDVITVKLLGVKVFCGKTLSKHF